MIWKRTATDLPQHSLPEKEPVLFPLKWAVEKPMKTMLQILFWKVNFQYTIAYAFFVYNLSRILFNVSDDEIALCENINTRNLSLN